MNLYIFINIFFPLLDPHSADLFIDNLISIPFAAGYPVERGSMMRSSLCDIRTPSTSDDITFYGPLAIRGGGHGGGHGHSGGHGHAGHDDLSHHYEENVLRQRERAKFKEEVANTLKIVTGLGTIGTLAYCWSL